MTLKISAAPLSMRQLQVKLIYESTAERHRLENWLYSSLSDSVPAFVRYAVDRQIAVLALTVKSLTEGFIDIS